jgi:hypothetical protein
VDLDGSVTPTGSVPGGAGTGANTGLPCDVQKILEDTCIGCHSGPSPKPLLTYADLVAPSSTAGKTMAQASLDRMKSTTSPMPPPPAVPPTAADIQTFQDWVNAGTPKGAVCTDPPPDGGAPAADSGSSPFNTAPICTSGKMYTGGNNSNMRPGEACQSCHQQRGGPRYTIAGTVYPTAHEPNDCNGAPGPMTVVVTDANNVVVNVPVNSVGNFMSSTRIASPFHVKVVNGTKVRAMVGSLTAGDCNSCHTQNGANGAPGRIVAP